MSSLTVTRLTLSRLKITATRTGLLSGRAPLARALIGLALLAGAPAMAQEAKPAADTSRLVSIGGAVTEIIYALGEEKRLVGRDSTSVYPAATSGVPDVGYMRQLSAEGVLATNPSAILAVEGSGPPEAVATLQKSGIAFLTVPESFDIKGVAGKVRTVGHFLGVDAKAEALAATVEADVEAAAGEAAKRPEAERKRVLFILSTQGGRIMASGTGTAADAIIRLAGAVNATRISRLQAALRRGDHHRQARCDPDDGSRRRSWRGQWRASRPPRHHPHPGRPAQGDHPHGWPASAGLRPAHGKRPA